MTSSLGTEPVAIIGALQAILIACQQLVLGIPAGVHAAIAVAIVICGALLARSQVTPIVPVPAPPPAPPSPPPPA
jgi:hypothetical protein